MNILGLACINLSTSILPPNIFIGGGMNIFFIYSLQHSILE